MSCHIELCGELVVEIDGRRVEAALPGRQGRLLFAYLVLNRGRTIGRDELADALWAHEPPAGRSTALRPLLSKLRAALGPGVVQGRSELALALPEDAWVDVEAAEAADDDARHALADGHGPRALASAREALELLGARLLPELADEWVEARRRELDDLRLSLLETRARAGYVMGGPELADAERGARELIEESPWKESGYALLMRIHAARGDAAAALVVFQEIRVKLRDELGASPSRELAELNESLLRQERDGGARAQPAAVALPPVLESLAGAGFVGREDVLERMRARWSERSGVLVLRGEPGIGKTHLLGQFAREAHEEGANVLYGRCDEQPLVAYQPFAEALEHYLAETELGDEAAPELEALARLLPAASDQDGTRAGLPGGLPGERYRLFEAVASLLRRAAGERPLLLVVDDMHWADEATVLLLRHVLRALAGRPVLTLVAFREPDVSPADPLAAVMADLRREQAVESVPLEGFDEEETGALIRARGAAAADDEFARALCAETDGNPFFMEEALRSLSEPSASALREMGAPEGVRELILRRLGGVGEPARRLLFAAAVAGPEFSLRLLADALDEPAEELVGGAEELAAAGLVVEVPGRVDEFAFRHALVREALYEELLASRRARLHERLARALEAQGGEVQAAELARHYFEARELTGIVGAVRWSVAAAEQASAALAWEQAMAHYRRALEALVQEPDENLGCEVLIALGHVQWHAADPHARDTFAEAAASARGRGSAEQLARAALGFRGLYTPAGVVDRELIELLEEALEALGPGDSALRARVMGRLADSLLFSDGPRALALSDEALELARRIGDSDALLAALSGNHAAHLHSSHLHSRARISAERLELAAREGGPEALAGALRWRTYDLLELGDLDGARREHVRMARLAADKRQPVYSYLVASRAVTFAQIEGRFSDAERMAGETVELARRAQAPDARMYVPALLFGTRREQGRLGELREDVELLIEQFPGFVAWRAFRALIDAETGHAERAAAEVEELSADACAALPADMFWLVAVASLAESGPSPAAAGSLYRALLPYADHYVPVGDNGWWGSAERFLGLLAAAQEDWDAADRHFERAHRRHAALGLAPLVARTAVGHAGVLLARGGPGDADRAAALLGEAEAVGRRLRMPRLLADIAALCERAVPARLA